MYTPDFLSFRNRQIVFSLNDRWNEIIETAFADHCNRPSCQSHHSGRTAGRTAWWEARLPVGMLEDWWWALHDEGLGTWKPGSQSRNLPLFSWQATTVASSSRAGLRRWRSWVAAWECSETAPWPWQTLWAPCSSLGCCSQLGPVLVGRAGLVELMT
jgi:hypothetical protein